MRAQCLEGKQDTKPFCTVLKFKVSMSLHKAVYAHVQIRVTSSKYPWQFLASCRTEMKGK